MSMADNNPAGNPPSAENSSPLDDDILATLSLNDTGSSNEPTPPASVPSGEGGEVGSAPATPPNTPPEEQPNAPPEPPAPAPTEGKPPAPAAPAPSEPQPAAPNADPEAGLREASLAAQVDALQREIANLRASPQPSGEQPPAPAAPGSGETPAEKPFVYNLSIPEPTQKALLSDDPAQNIAAIQAISNTLGTIVHNNVIHQVRAEVRGMLASLQQLASQGEAATTEEQAREQAKDAYYKAFPTHKNDLIEPIIRQQAVALSAEHPGLPFNDQYINALGARVNAALEKLGAKPQEPAPNPAPTPTPRPAAHLPSGPRAGDIGQPTGGSLGEDILGTLDPFSAG